jgi:penicillin-binding protein 1A
MRKWRGKSPQILTFPGQMLKKIARITGKILKAMARAFASWVRALSAQLRKPAYRAHVASWLRFFAVATGAGVLVLAVTFAYFSFSLPSLEGLERLEPGRITRVTGRNGALVHEFYIQRRIWMPEEKMPERLKQAVIAIEDRSFREHWGVDLTAYPSALMPAVFGGRARGASTLTQQLAKNLFLTPERSVGRKVREILLALQIERNYTKKEILEFYFNHVYLGAGAYGFVSASERYFSKPLDSLTTDQYAVLAGLLQRPEAYRPDINPGVSRARRDVVLGAMRRAGFLTRREYKAALAAPLGTRAYRAPSDLGPYFIEHVRQFLSARWGDEFVYNLGGSVDITMDSALQHVADSALRFRLAGIRARMQLRTARAYNLPKLLNVPLDTLLNDWDRRYAAFERRYVAPDSAGAAKRFPRQYRYRRPQAALLLIENATGAVRALVGGENFDVSKYNRALQAVRSPGSSFKPFVYATAVERGAGPGDILHDQPISIPEASDTSRIWQPTNFDPGFEGRMTMRRAFYRSQNLPAVEVALKYGLDNVADLARRAGFRHRVDPVPSLALGSCDVTLLELTSAYTVFPNGGSRAEPYFVERVRDRTGKVLYRNEARRESVVAPEVAWIVTSMLRDVNIRGTAAAVWASGLRHPSGGKTGTTNEFTDAWYVGFTKAYTAGIWVGLDDYSPMGSGHTGSANAVPLWTDLFHAATRGQPLQDFPRPEGVAEVSICPVSGMRAQFYCSGAYTDYYTAGHEPGICLPTQHVLHRRPEADDREAPGEPAPSAPPAPKKEDRRLKKTF